MHPSMSSHTQTHTAMLSKDFSALNASRILNTFFFFSWLLGQYLPSDLDWGWGWVGWIRSSADLEVTLSSVLFFLTNKYRHSTCPHDPFGVGPRLLLYRCCTLYRSNCPSLLPFLPQFGLLPLPDLSQRKLFWHSLTWFLFFRVCPISFVTWGPADSYISFLLWYFPQTLPLPHVASFSLYWAHSHFGTLASWCPLPVNFLFPCVFTWIVLYC